MTENIIKLKKILFFKFQDKRKIQEEISQKRLKIEEEKLHHQHLKVICDYFPFSDLIF